MKKVLALVFLAITIGAALDISAQTTAFTYQGSLRDGANQANGNYDFEFALFDAVSGGSQVGSTLTQNAVAVANGIFSVSLDFGSQFPGASRFLEIRVRLTGQPSLTTLTPRQQINSGPYSIKSIASDTATTAANAAQLGGVAASQYVVTTDVRMTDARPPTAGSANYIQNQNAGAQAASNFNISGNGTLGGVLVANRVASETQFSIAGFRVLAVPEFENLYVGPYAGFSHTSGTGNTFVGPYAGRENTSGSNNSFFGHNSGIVNTASSNAFFGSRAGESNTSGFFNSFFGRFSGNNNTLGAQNSFFGHQAGNGNVDGNDNVFVGKSAGQSNTGGDDNTMIGSGADVGTGNLTNATAIGANAQVTTSNSLVLGNGVNVGIGTTSPNVKLQVVGGSDAGLGSGGYIVTGQTTTANIVIDDNEIMARNNGGTAALFINNSGGNVNLIQTGTGSVGIGTSSPGAKLHVDGGVIVQGLFELRTLAAAGSTQLCRNASDYIATCSSSLRYKTNVQSFFGGLDVVRRLRPINFDWKDGGSKDVGFAAEEVEQVEPLLATYNQAGQVEGVKYGQVTTILVNAVKEQQTQIEILQGTNDRQQNLIEQQQRQIDELKNLMCSIKTDSEICKSKKNQK